jgi:hypothetical protein
MNNELKRMHKEFECKYYTDIEKKGNWGGFRIVGMPGEI